MNFRAACADILATCRALADRGFLAGTGGNVAVRADADHFAVTPSGTDYYSMSIRDVCVLRFGDFKQVAGDLTPSVESGLHARLLTARPDCNCSIHTHQPLASAYALFARPLVVRSAAQRRLLGDVVPCAGYAPSGTAWLAHKVAKLARADVQACLMRNHGVVCVGEDSAVAMRRLEALEAACGEYFATKLPSNAQRLPEAVTTAVKTATRSP